MAGNKINELFATILGLKLAAKRFQTGTRKVVFRHCPVVVKRERERTRARNNISSQKVAMFAQIERSYANDLSF